MFQRSRPKNIKKDYQRKDLRNPFFHRQAAGKRFFPLHWTILAIILLSALLIWFFLAAPFWRLEQIKVSGLTRVPGGNLENIVWQQTAASRGLLFKQSNLFLFDQEEAEVAILAEYNFAGVEIEKLWPRTLAVKVSERPYAFIFQEGSQLSYASADAYLIQEPAIQEEDKKKYFILENKNSETLVGEKDKIRISESYLNFIMNLNQGLAAYPELSVERYIIDQEFNTIKVKFAGGPQAYFNVKDDAVKQIALLLLVKKEKIKDNFSRTNYIDLRYGDRIFINPDFK
ncbi:MAG: FtsQ-type POTRA domain-containing protein [Patescibacteria group bacterium]